jgi:diaminohydroxyphosphoribosylaminopyrimidine deaminase/5-amino-6-(5-phosphoribosylamino)uracil reductase
MEKDEAFLKEALFEARKRKGFTSPNPSVGAVVVRDGRIIARGHHWAVGYPHAEAVALEGLAPAQVEGSTVYVTLEPCNHHGRTPPCTELLIRNKISRVVYGYRDPDVRVNGSGESALSRAGIRVQAMDLEEIEEFYHPYAHWVKSSYPFVRLKLAVSIDGKFALEGGKRAFLTGPESERFTHTKRLGTDAILTSARTLLCDDPQLNVRLGEEIMKPLYIVDKDLSLKTSLRIFQAPREITVFHDCEDEKRRSALGQSGARFVRVGSRDGLDMDEVMRSIGQRGVHDLWVEAGATLLGAIWRAGLAQEFYLYIAPVTVGSHGTELPDLDFSSCRVRWMESGRDVIGCMERL